MPERSLFLGVDVGTSGVRALLIDTQGRVVASASEPMAAPEHSADGSVTQSPAIWRRAFEQVIAALPEPERVRAVAIDGTSGTLLLADAAGEPLGAASMYNDASAGHLAQAIAERAPPESGAHGATSPLARLLVQQERFPQARRALHQADWLAASLTGRYGVSDDNNALKLGWDAVRRAWPAWIGELGVRQALLPEVVLPGTPLGEVRAGPLAGAAVVAGTTDGCASFLATGARANGDGVTALGSTLTIKLLSDRPIFAPEFGVYSHRLGERWLVGGASNSGGAALLRFFAADEIEALTPALRPERPTGRLWHPLPDKGERFPVRDPAMTFEPDDRPADRAPFLQALLEGVAGVEAKAYRTLQELGAPRLRAVRTVGGGAANRTWTAIRRRYLGVPMAEPLSTEAAYGAARIAQGAVPSGA
ncbi:MAG: FGGY-family carbohydrate kinase, partial [Geminicoccales bacterium]